MRVTWTVTHTPLRGSRYDTANTKTYTKFNGVKIKPRLGDTKDTFSMKARVTDPELVGRINIGDLIQLKRTMNASYSAPDIDFTGRVVDKPWTKNPSENTLEVEGYSYSDAITNGIVGVDAENLTIPEAIKLAIQEIAGFGSRTLPITWDESNPMVNSNGDPFPIVGEKLYNKRARYVVTKYSTAEETQDGTYIWYIDENNKFIWKRASDQVDHTFDASTDKYVEIGEETDRDGMVNYVVIKGGTDPSGKAITVTDFDSQKTQKYGQQFRYIPDIAANANTLNQRDMAMLQEQYEEELESLDPESQEYEDLVAEGGYTGRRYPKEADYQNDGFTTTWRSLNNENEPVTVFNDDEYVAAIQAHVRLACEKEARRIIEANKYGEQKIELSFKAGKGWRLADVIRAKIKGLAQEELQMRVAQAEFTNTRDTFVLLVDTGEV